MSHYQHYKSVRLFCVRPFLRTSASHLLSVTEGDAANLAQAAKEMAAEEAVRLNSVKAAIARERAADKARKLLQADKLVKQDQASRSRLAASGSKTAQPDTASVAAEGTDAESANKNAKSLEFWAKNKSTDVQLTGDHKPLDAGQVM